MVHLLGSYWNLHNMYFEISAFVTLKKNRDINAQTFTLASVTK